MGFLFVCNKLSPAALRLFYWSSVFYHFTYSASWSMSLFVQLIWNSLASWTLMFVFFPRLGMFSATISSFCVCVCVCILFLSLLCDSWISMSFCLMLFQKSLRYLQFFKKNLFHLASLDAFHHFCSSFLTWPSFYLIQSAIEPL